MSKTLLLREPCLSLFVFYLIWKNGKLFVYFSNIFFLDFIKQNLGPIKKKMRHGSLHPHLNSMYVKFQ